MIAWIGCGPIQDAGGVTKDGVTARFKCELHIYTQCVSLLHTMCFIFTHNVFHIFAQCVSHLHTMCFTFTHIHLIILRRLHWNTSRRTEKHWNAMKCVTSNMFHINTHLILRCKALHWKGIIRERYTFTHIYTFIHASNVFHIALGKYNQGKILERRSRDCLNSYHQPLRHC